MIDNRETGPNSIIIVSLSLWWVVGLMTAWHAIDDYIGLELKGLNCHNHIHNLSCLVIIKVFLRFSCDLPKEGQEGVVWVGL